MTKIAFVTGANDAYFPMLMELIHSIRKTVVGKIEAYDICVMDTGLTPDQRIIIEENAERVIAPDWPCYIPESRIRGRDYLKSCVCRPFINQIFDGYDTYIWLDGDTWVQDWDAIDLLIRGAEKSKLAICPQADRAYGKAMRLKWLGPLPWKARSFYYSNGKKAFGGKVARTLFPYSALNVGVFSMAGDAPHWARWQELILKALKKGKVFTAEQLTMGMMVYMDGYSAEFLPAYCNWLCDTQPVFDEERGIFTEPYLPHHPIGVMHLSGYDKMRLDRSVKVVTKTTDDKAMDLCYRYPDLDGEKAV